MTINKVGCIWCCQVLILFSLFSGVMILLSWYLLRCVREYIDILIIMEHSALTGSCSMNLVASMAEAKVVNPKTCIICQEDNRETVTSEKTGYARVNGAAKIRNDVVTKRIKVVIGEDMEDDDNDFFLYHNTNKCYKSYTYSKKITAIEQKNARVEELMECHTESESSESVGLRRTLRKSVVPCAPPSSGKDSKTLPCVICGNVEHKKFRDKLRICEYDSANIFIDAEMNSKYDVFIRTADRLKDDERSSIKSIISAIFI